MEELKVPTVMVEGRKRAILTQDKFRALYVDGLPEGLERLAVVAGMTWPQLAARLGVGGGRVQEWRHGRLPDSDEVGALIEVASRVSGGLAALYPQLHAALAAADGGERARWA